MRRRRERMRMRFTSLCWRRCPAKEIANTVDARQRPICIPFLHYLVGPSLRSEQLKTFLT
jgi:hypothetical protein